jgi:hypothetical protein
MQTLVLHFLKELLSPFCFSSKRYHCIRFLFDVCKRGIEHVVQNWKKSEKKRVLHTVMKYLFAACKRVSDCL